MSTEKHLIKQQEPEKKSWVDGVHKGYAVKIGLSVSMKSIGGVDMEHKGKSFTFTGKSILVYQVYRKKNIETDKEIKRTNTGNTRKGEAKSGSHL